VEACQRELADSAAGEAPSGEDEMAHCRKLIQDVAWEPFGEVPTVPDEALQGRVWGERHSKYEHCPELWLAVQTRHGTAVPGYMMAGAPADTA